MNVIRNIVDVLSNIFRFIFNIHSYEQEYNLICYTDLIHNLEKGTFGNWKFIRKIGDNRSNVVEVHNIMKRGVIKIYQNQELKILKYINSNPHSNIISILEIFNDKEIRSCIMEYYPCDLFYFIAENNRYTYNIRLSILEWGGSLDAENAYIDDITKIFRGILIGVAYLHDSYILHRDIKPENILLDKNNIPKIADFGYSLIFTKGDDLSYIGNKDSTPCGSYPYMCPDIFSKRLYNKFSDLWAIMCSLFAALTNTNYNRLSNKEIIESDDIDKLFRRSIIPFDVIKSVLLRNIMERVLLRRDMNEIDVNYILYDKLEYIKY